MPEATLSSKNQIVIPREAREALKIKAGDKVIVSVQSTRVIVIEKPKSYAEALRGIARKTYPKNYLKKERRSWE
jgi:AbrB family looped-hinge helix DNA binding protein